MSNNAWYEHCGFGNGNNPDESVLLEWTQIAVSWMNIVPMGGSPEETNGLKVYLVVFWFDILSIYLHLCFKIRKSPVNCIFRKTLLNLHDVVLFQVFVNGKHLESCSNRYADRRNSGTPKVRLGCSQDRTRYVPTRIHNIPY